MDSVTQIALGASVAGLVAPPGFRRRALIWGGCLGTLPDLDVLVSLGDPVSDFTYHRGASHSFFFMTLVTPLLALLGWRVHRNELSFARWACLTWLVLITHALLDCFTTYGTQVLLPFSNDPVAWSSIFIIDPLYTLPLIVGVVCLALRPQSLRALRVMSVGVVLSSIYLAWGLVAKLWITPGVTASLKDQGVNSEQVLIMPSPFNSVVWRVLAVESDQFHEGFVSVFNPDHEVQLHSYPQATVPPEIATMWAFERLTWFARGFNRFEVRADQWVVTDLRMGTYPWFVFTFAIAQRTDSPAHGTGQWREMRPQQLPAGPVPRNTMGRLWDIAWGDPESTD